MGGSTTVKLRFVQAFRDRHGKRRYYFRRLGMRVPLPGPFASREFMEAYAAALAEMPGPRRPEKHKPAAPGTIADLATRYYASPAFLGLAPSTRKDYRGTINRFVADHGHRKANEMTRESVDILVGKLADRPGAGVTFLKRLRTLLRYGIALRLLDHDPTIGAKSYKLGEIHTWTDEELAAFEARWEPGSTPRLAYALMLYTGQRSSDVMKMTWGDIAGDRIRVAQQKTNEKLTIPLHPKLQAELAAVRRKHVAIVTSRKGKPFAGPGLRQMVSNAITAAGLPDRCTPHGLRKAAARRLAEASCSSKEIAAITGHRTLAEVERYTRAADQEMLARRAIEKQTAGENEMWLKIVKGDVG